MVSDIWWLVCYACFADIIKITEVLSAPLQDEDEIINNRDPS